MDTRISSMNQIEIKAGIDDALKFVHEHRDITLFHVVIAAIVRTISQRPAINRFVSGQRIYARNSIDIAFTIKRELTDEAGETVVKITFEPTDTVYDVSRRIKQSIEQAKSDTEKDDDALARVVTKAPRFLIRMFIAFLKLLEYYNLLPKFIIKLDPFHTSIFISNLGSIGVSSVNHHLYNWGTTSLFLAMSGIERTTIAERDGSIKNKKVLSMSFSCDDRICDGLYYGRSVKLLQSLIQNPSRLENPPETVVEDVM